MKESKDRAEYRAKCRYRGMYEKCYKKSGCYGNCHVSIACTPDTDCPRMKRYDKLKNNPE